MEKNEVASAVIEAYRELIRQRYQHAYLSTHYDIPASFDNDRISLFRNFFLDFIYPPIEKRKQLDAAFESLDRHIKNPKHLLSILIDSSRILFKFGRHLPKILNAAIKALRSFRKANHFEDRLTSEAFHQGLNAPISQDELKTIVASLPKSDVMSFINESKSLFEIIQDKKLVEKIIELLKQLIGRMKKSNIYDDAEISAFQIGLDIISGSYELFNQLNPTEAKQLFSTGVEIETAEIERIYREYGID